MILVPLTRMSVGALSGMALITRICALLVEPQLVVTTLKAARVNVRGRAVNVRNIFISQGSLVVSRKVCQQLVRTIRRASVEARFLFLNMAARPAIIGGPPALSEYPILLHRSAGPRSPGS